VRLDFTRCGGFFHGEIMADIEKLKVELDTDPLLRGYSGMTDQQAATDLNTKYRDKPRTEMSQSEAFQHIDSAELRALADGDRSLVMAILAFQTINPFGNESTVFQDIFGGGSATITALNAARTVVNGQSRAEELNLGQVSAGAVRHARSL